MDDRQNIDKNLGNSGESEEINELVDKIAKYLIQNNISQGFFQSAITEVIQSWGKESRVKNTLTKPILRTIARGWPDHGSQSKRLQEIEHTLKQHTTAQELSQKMPVVINLGLEMCKDLSRELAEAEPDKKSQIFANLISETNTGILGSVLSNLAKSIQDVHQNDPEILSRELGPHIEDFIQNSDMGQIKETLLDSEQDVLKIIGIINQTLWEQPAKVVSLLSILPQILSAASKSLGKTLEPLEELPPDIFADVVLALARDIPGRDLAQITNQFLEIIRKFHTGSELLGEQNNPMLDQVLELFVQEFLLDLDSELLINSGNRLQEIKESTQQTIRHELHKNPELANRYFRNKFQALSQKSREKSEKLDMLENLEQDRELNQMLGSYLDEMDPAQPAENLNRIFSLINEAHSQDPELIPEFCEQFLSSLDETEIKDIWLLLQDTILKHNQGLVETVLPSMINTLADLISSSNDSSRDELAKSVLHLRNSIQNLEVDS